LYELRDRSLAGRWLSGGVYVVTESRYGGAPDGLIGRTIGRYIVRHKLAVGGTGSVYIAEHPWIGKRVALKVLHVELAARPDIVGRFFNEARAVNDIQHPNIVDIVDFGVIEAASANEPAVVYLLMEYLDGENLGRVIRRDAPLPPDRALTIGLQIADALSASHGKGIVHRDLKPDNVMLVPRGRERDFVKILDFGIAKLTVNATGSQRTQTGVVIGTPQYMSPEQCEGLSTVDHRTDIYALGIVLYEMLTGRVPFRGEGFAEVLVQQMSSSPVPLSAIAPGIPPHVERAVLKALEKRPEDRFQRVADLARALQDPQPSVATRETSVVSALPRNQAREVSVASALPRDPAREVSGVSALPRDPAREVSGMSALPRDPAAADAAAKPTIIGDVLHAKPTTLSGSAAEASMSLPARRGMRVQAALWLAAGLAIGGIVVGLVARGFDGSPDRPATAALTAEPTRVRVLIDSTPQGASVAIGGRLQGITPYAGEIERSDQPVEVELTLARYQPATRTVVLAEDIVLSLSLDRAPDNAPVPAGSAH
jgi:serine/threonine protein kinase